MRRETPRNTHLVGGTRVRFWRAAVPAGRARRAGSGGWNPIAGTAPDADTGGVDPQIVRYSERPELWEGTDDLSAGIFEYVGDGPVMSVVGAEHGSQRAAGHRRLAESPALPR
jgi:hypothetical protein